MIRHENHHRNRKRCLYRHLWSNEQGNLEFFPSSLPQDPTQAPRGDRERERQCRYRYRWGCGTIKTHLEHEPSIHLAVQLSIALQESVNISETRCGATPCLDAKDARYPFQLSMYCSFFRCPVSVRLTGFAFSPGNHSINLSPLNISNRTSRYR